MSKQEKTKHIDAIIIILIFWLGSIGITIFITLIFPVLSASLQDKPLIPMDKKAIRWVGLVFAYMFVVVQAAFWVFIPKQVMKFLGVIK